MQKKFDKQIIKYNSYLKKYSAIFDTLGYLKLAALLLLIVSAYFTFSKGLPFYLCAASAALLIISIFLWVYHAKIHGKVNYFNGIIAINRQYLGRVSGEWAAFPDTGEEFIDIEHPYACDLDIVGKKSLFQLLNVTNTWHGRQAFANDLLCPGYDKNELLLRQEAVAELGREVEFTNKIQYYTSKIGVNKSVIKLIDDFKGTKTFIKSKFIKYLLLICPVVIAVFVLAIIVLQLKYLYLTGATLLLIQSLIWLAGYSGASKYLDPIAGMAKLGDYSVVLGLLQNQHFDSKKLNQIKSKLVTSSLSATTAIKDLDNIVKKMSVKNNWLLYFILNVLLLWDYECGFMLQDWKAKYSGAAESWFLALGEFESLLSFAGLANVCSTTCIPVIAKEGKIIEAADMGHPLITNDIRVSNDFSANKNIFIISGSNMSGKTTFLRTAGINLVLANAGCCVCARQMTFSFFKLMTSMRVADDLGGGISTFYAELKRIKRIIDMTKDNTDMFFLIDEIFKGTNSVDRLYGARTVISKLSASGAMGIVTTHDLELCELANQYSRIKNYSFSEHYKDNKILFDYKIREGRSNTTNAKYLMEMIGIL